MSLLRSLLWVFALLGTVPAFAQGLAWQYEDPVPQSTGARATLFGFPFPQPYEQPGFSPSAVVAREDGAYLILPVNGGGNSYQLDSVLNPSWHLLRGFQILRLDATGQVLWKRFWNRGRIAFDWSANYALELSEARLTPDGGLAVLVGDRVLYLSAGGDARLVYASLPPAGCFPFRTLPPIKDIQLNADAELVVNFSRTGNTPEFACALGSSGQLLDSVDAPGEQSMQVLDYRRGSGFLVATTDASQPTGIVQNMRLRQGSVDHWLRSSPFIGGDRLWLSPAGDAWLPDSDSTLRIIRPDGSQRAEIVQTGELKVRAWLADGDALLGDYGVSELRRVSADGIERWRLARTSTSADLSEWQVLGNSARLLAAQGSDADGEILTLDLATGSLQIGTDFTLGGLAAGPLGLARHVSVDSGEPESRWLRDPSSCVELVCAPQGASFASTVDVQVFDSTTGDALAGPTAAGFDFPTYARLRERAPAVAREPNTLEVAHARYVSNGEKELLEVTRLSQYGQLLWRRQLAFPRFDAADAQVEVVNGAVYVTASARGPGAAEHRLWALDVQGQISWERALDEPFKQLTRVFAGSVYQLCGLGYTQRSGIPWIAPLWRCYDASGTLQADTRLTQFPKGRDVVISHAQGSRAFLRVLDEPIQSASGVQLLAINALGSTVAGGVNWQFEVLETGEFVRVDAVTRRGINLVTAPVYAWSQTIFPHRMLVAAFDATGNRLWQQRIDQPLRPAGDGQTYTAVDTDGQGIVHVAFLPNIELRSALRVCRLAAADGALLGCADTPLDGRIGAVFATSEPLGLWMWANQTLPSGANQLTLFPLTADGIGAPVYQQQGLQMRQAGSELGRFDRSWAVVEPTGYAGVYGDVAPPRTRVLLFQPGAIFGNGFEVEDAP
jgi:hypothetical protein